MEQWQGCLAPICQLALKHAHETVTQRGGDVVTAEDLLLALLDVDTALVPFLLRWGVDLDELVRTVQCEQPLLPQSGVEAGLSVALIDWLASTRERQQSPWLTTQHLLSTLTYAAERFQDKAYVAVLEQISEAAWELLPQTPLTAVNSPETEAATELVADMPRSEVTGFPLSAATHDLAINLAARAMADRSGLLWLQCPSQTRVDWLIGQVRRMVGSAAVAHFSRGDGIRRRWYRVNWQLACVSSEALEAMFTAMEGCCRRYRPAAFVFPECPPALLVAMIERIGVLRWRHMLAVVRPLLLLSSPTLKCPTDPEDWLEDSLGVRVQQYSVPLLSTGDCLRYLRFCQPGLERQWGIEITDEALEVAASLGSFSGGETDEGTATACSNPDLALDLLREALNIKLAHQANGSATLTGLRANREDLERQRLLTVARPAKSRLFPGHQQDKRIAQVLAELDQVCLELAAEEVHWHEYAASPASALGADEVRDQARWNARVVSVDGVTG